VLGREPSVVEYQVHQTSSGATILIRCTVTPDLDRLRARIVDGLQRAGVGGGTIALQIVEYIPRQSSGKLKRFVPLGVGMTSPTA
jgi:hypothetical protein